MKKHDILYTPKIDYEKSYYTEGNFTEVQNELHSSNNNINNDNNNSNINMQVIKNLENKIEQGLKLVPNVLVNTYLSPYIIMRDEFKHLNIPENKEPEKEKEHEEIILNQEEKAPQDEDRVPDFFEKDTDFYIDIVDPYKDKSNLIKNQYITDFIDIYKDYLNKLNNIIENYTYVILKGISKNDSKLLESYTTKDNKNKNLYHVSDFLTKSSIVSEQNIRFHKKMFDLDQSILHIRSIKVSTAQIVRYYEEEKLRANTEIALESNVLLNESRIIADKKYKENFYELYKYLNSSVILLQGSINAVIKQYESIMILNQYE